MRGNTGARRGCCAHGTVNAPVTRTNCNPAVTARTHLAGNTGARRGCCDHGSVIAAVAYEHMFAYAGGPLPKRPRILVCALVPRFALRVAMGGSLGDVPAALAPEAGGSPLVGEVNAAAATFGVRPGMRSGEAIARCPGIRLVTADPGAVAAAAEELLAGLEAIGPAVEPLEPGHALFRADGLLRMHGGLGRLLHAAGKLLPPGGRIGAGPGRFTARAAAIKARPGRPRVVDADGAPGFIGRMAVGRLGLDARITDELEALGIRTAGAAPPPPRRPAAPPPPPRRARSLRPRRHRRPPPRPGRG